MCSQSSSAACVGRLHQQGGALLLALDHPGEVEAVSVSPDDHRVLSASRDGTVRLWDLESGAQLATFRGRDADDNRPPPKTRAVSRDGRLNVSVSADKSALRVWDPTSGTDIFTLTGHTDEINAVAMRRGRFGAARCRTASWCRKARTSASRSARVRILDRTVAIKAMRVAVILKPTIAAWRSKPQSRQHVRSFW